MFKTAITAIFLAITLALQVIGLPKPVTGVIVNMIYGSSGLSVPKG
jgi:hypothetical protein